MKLVRKTKFLMNLLGNGGSETLIFLRENNDLGADPPKVPLLAKFIEKWRILLKVICFRQIPRSPIKNA